MTSDTNKSGWLRGGHLEDAYPLTALQAGMLFHSEYSPESAVYHDMVSVSLEAPFDQAALSQVLDDLVRRHDVLRTCFDLVRFSEPMQLVYREAAIPLEVQDWRSLSSADQEAAYAAWVRAEKSRRLDWSRPPLVRAFAHRLDEQNFGLSLSFHHAILDGWSVASMITEITHNYAYRLGLRGDPVPPRPGARFRDYVALEREALAAPAAWEFWSDRCQRGAAGSIPRWTAGAESKGADEHRIHAVIVPPQVLEGLNRLSRSTGVPLRSLVLAAHLWVIGKVTGDQAVVTGTVVNCRPEVAGGDRALGLFINTIPLPLSLEGGTWEHLAQVTFAAEQEALPFRRFPLAEMQRRTGGESLFEVAFNYIHFHVYQDAHQNAGVRLGRRRFFEQTNFPLGVSFVLDPSAAELWFTLQYYWPYFSDSQIRLLGGYYLEALTDMAAHPDNRYESFCPLAPSERRQLLLEWNGTERSYGPAKCLHELVADRARECPEAPAIIFRSERLTYRELNERANQLGHYLQRLGVGPEVTVGVYAERSPELVIAMLGILKAGGAYVALDPEYPAERLRHMLADSHTRVVLAQGPFEGIVPAGAVSIVQLDADWEQVAGESAVAPQCAVTPDNLAYVIYTSGSTGRPKGVLIQHRAIYNRLSWMQEAYGLTHADRFLQKTPISFDVSVGEIFGPLSVGGAVVLAEPGLHRDTRHLAQVIAGAGVTTVYFVPMMLQAFLEEEKLAYCRTLRRVICGGEELPHGLQNLFHERLQHQGIALSVEYGPTEAAVNVTYWECRPGDRHRRVPIGRPIGNTRIHILDENDELAPIGVPGQLCIAGANVGRGYLGRPSLTAEKFVPDPYALQPGDRMYRTGDRARWLPDGTLEFLGRLDNQVKVRGHRIELGEVEVVLREHPDVRESVVAMCDDRFGEKRLVAYVVPTGDTQPAVETMIRHLRAALPEYMVPSAFLFLTVIPMTVNGKVDASALPVPDTFAGDRPPPVPPGTDLERKLVGLWQEVLGINPIGITDRFFDLGGNSILALRLITRIRRDLSRDLPLSLLFHEGETVAELANVIERAEAQRYKAVVPLQPHGKRPPFFLVHPLGGHVFSYMHFVRRFGSDMPVYGLQARGFQVGEDPFPSITEMAAHYVREVTAIWPQGPYFVGGWCLGGMVAFEMVRQLTAQGKPVGPVIVISSSVLQSYPEHAPAIAHDDTRLLMQIFGPGLSLPLEELRKLPLDEQLALILSEAKAANVLRSDVHTLEHARRLVRIYKAHGAATLEYPWPTYSGSVVLLKGEQDHLPDTPAGDMGWRKVTTGDLQVRVVPGNHYSMLAEPNVQELATEIKRVLDNA